ncbi:MAG: PQQ-dependent sugar dehydrogenase [Actinomycetia bacterium]|nr:PQQ-dependent sugar dehydrogenase [Actinomycetes bacterium]
MRRRRFIAGLAALAVTGACSDGGDAEPKRTQSSGSGSGDASGPGGKTTSPSDTRVHPSVDSVIASGLNVPWSVVFLPGGDALVSERDAAHILRMSADGRTIDLGELPDVAPSSDFGEGGLLGLAIAPDDSNTIFAYHTTDDDNRIVRLRIDGDRLGKPEPVLTGIPASTHHNGGRLALGPDGLLYASTGDAEQSDRAQDTDDLGGKILRIRPDGRPASGNPFGNEVWTYGHRNVEGLAFDGKGRLWASEFGDADVDELNLIERGNNYGWPEVEGMGDGEFTNPLNTWPTAECSPAGIAVTRSTAFLGALRGERLIAVPLRGTRTGKPSASFVGEYGRIREVSVAPDGALWVTTSNTDGRATAGPKDDRILRVKV